MYISNFSIDAEIVRSKVQVMSESLNMQAERIHNLENALNNQILSYYDSYGKCNKKIQAMEKRINRFVAIVLVNNKLALT